MVTVSVPVMDNNGTTFDLDQCRAAIRAATTAITELMGLLWQVEDAELGPLLGTLDQLAALAEVPALLSFVRRSRVERPCASQAGSTSGWVAEQAPTVTAGVAAGQVAPLGRKDARPDLSWVCRCG